MLDRSAPRPDGVPVILMHGFGTTTHLLKNSAAVGIVEHLRGRGINAHAPYVVPYATIAERAGMWKTHLDEIVANSASDHAHLIGFSMGGLDARYLISVLGAHQNVATLTTVATPHHGSPLASFVLSRPALLKNLIVGSMNRVGTYAFTEAASNAEAA
ncbi:MAG: lipase, partial [Bacteroidota bacterium]